MEVNMFTDTGNTHIVYCTISSYRTRMSLRLTAGSKSTSELAFLMSKWSCWFMKGRQYTSGHALNSWCWVSEERFGVIDAQCMTSKLSIVDVLSEADCTLRTESGHKYHVNAVLTDPTLSSVHGVKGASPFTSLAMFNPVTFFPPEL